ncbi:MAG: hypothetical protein ACKV2U_15500 [Bryobacteraceae bacterium]
MDDVPLTLPEDQVYQTIGDDGFRRLVHAFYRQVPNDDILGPIYPAADLDGAEIRLRQFLTFRFGGPHTCTEERRPSASRHAPQQALRHFVGYGATTRINRKEASLMSAPSPSQWRVLAGCRVRVGLRKSDESHRNRTPPLTVPPGQGD